MIEQPDSKTALRRRLRQLRREIGTPGRRAMDRAICQHLLQLVATRKAHTIAAFSPFDGEPDITPVYQLLSDNRVVLALPDISTGPVSSMVFRTWQPGLEMQHNTHGILEPRDTAVMKPSDMDILFLPLVAYDGKGNRLGVGAGYYDRYLHAFRDRPQPLRVGAAYGIQEIDHIQSDDWDVPLHGVVNEHGYVAFAG